MVTYIVQWFSEMPSITKGLLFIYLTTGILSEFLPLSVVNNYFMLNSNNMCTCVTSFFYFGHLFSLSYLYELLLFLSYSKSLEYEYLSLNRRKNYLFCLLIGLIIILKILMEQLSFIQHYLSIRNI
jgi:hypothetical protein